MRSDQAWMSQYLGQWLPADAVFSIEELRALEKVLAAEYVRELADLYYDHTNEERCKAPRRSRLESVDTSPQHIADLKRRAAKIIAAS